MKSQWFSTIKWLRDNFSCNKRVIIRTVKLKDIDGDCSYNKSVFYIRIDKNQSHSAKIATLIHEWAHVLGWFKGQRSIDHNSEWGKIYAEIYESWAKWANERWT